MTATNQAAGLPTTSKVLCAVYAVIAIAALIATWSQNLSYADRGIEFFPAREIRVGRTDPARAGSADAIGLALLAVLTAAFTIWVDVL